MKHLASAVALAALTAAVASGPSVAAPGECRALLAGDPPAPTGETVCRQDAWFRAAGGQRVANAPGAAVPSWNTTKPTQAFSSGGAVYGALRPVDMLESSPQVRPTFTGTYKGTLDNIAVSAFQSSIYSALGGDMAIYTRLTIDGEVVFENAAAADPQVDVPLTQTDDRTVRMDFAWTNLASTLRSLGIANGPDAQHTITLSFVNKYYGDSNFLMYFDAAEYPSGVTFNLEPDPETGEIPGFANINTEV